MGCLLVVALIVGGVWFGIWGRHTELRYAIEHSADLSQVTVERQPKDCDFLHAPLGLKDCHYEKEVTVVRHALDVETSRPIVSYDDGKTWNWEDGGPGKGVSVYVSWLKESP